MPRLTLFAARARASGAIWQSHHESGPGRLHCRSTRLVCQGGSLQFRSLASAPRAITALAARRQGRRATARKTASPARMAGRAQGATTVWQGRPTSSRARLDITAPTERTSRASARLDTTALWARGRRSPQARPRGNVCPTGHYCPKGSSTPVACGPGFYSSATGNKNADDCKPCKGGYVCPMSNTSVPSKLCPGGYYCPNGTSVATLTCPEGSECPLGSAAPSPCAAGTYQDASGQSSCDVCPAGSFCLQGSNAYTECPRGHYCPAETTYATEFPCPVGTFSNRTQLQAADDCSDCLPGMYCLTTGLLAPIGLCEPGYYCGGGSSTATPASGYDSYFGDSCVDASGAAENDLCPFGHYCLLGSIAPFACPPGTIGASQGLENITQCTECPMGFYCPQEGQYNASLGCTPGYFCPGGDVDPTLKCPRGHYCAGDDAAPLPCAAGTYQNVTGQAECKTCPPGYYCLEGSEMPLNCPGGFYCPAGTTYGTEYLCPAGTFTNGSQLKDVSDCEPCLPGMYCPVAGLAYPQGLCEPGYYCGRGASTSTPASGYDSYLGDSCVEPSGAEDNDLCPRGHYCPTGSTAPVECPPGTIGASQALMNITQCEECPMGFYCPRMGQYEASDGCTPGYFCPGGDVDPTLKCPRGHYCAGNDAAPLPCEAGTYQNVTGQAECKTCPSAYYCLEGTESPLPCVQGHYCPAGTPLATDYPCPTGTFSNITMLSDSLDCAECLPGMYCDRTGLTHPVGLCEPGFYCGGGSSTATPASGYDSYFGDSCVDASGAAENDLCPLATTVCSARSRRSLALRAPSAHRKASKTSRSALSARWAFTARRRASTRRAWDARPGTSVPEATSTRRSNARAATTAPATTLHRYRVRRARIKTSLARPSARRVHLGTTVSKARSSPCRACRATTVRQEHRWRQTILARQAPSPT